MFMHKKMGFYPYMHCKFNDAWSLSLHIIIYNYVLYIPANMHVIMNVMVMIFCKEIIYIKWKTLTQGLS